MIDSFVYWRANYRPGVNVPINPLLRKGLTLEEVAKRIAYYLKRSGRPITDVTLERLHPKSPGKILIEWLLTSEVTVTKENDEGEMINFPDEEYEKIMSIVRDRMARAQLR